MSKMLKITATYIKVVTLQISDKEYKCLLRGPNEVLALTRNNVRHEIIRAAGVKLEKQEPMWIESEYEDSLTGELLFKI